MLRWAARPATTPVCRHCGGTSGHPAIDGLACYPCILAIGRLVADPGHAELPTVVAAWEAHRDVVELRVCAAHGVQEWAWLGWTSEPDAHPDAAWDAVRAAYARAWAA